MLEKEPSGASPHHTQDSHLAGATPGGPFPRLQPPVKAVQYSPQTPCHYTLQFLIAVITKHSK
jgi:hypothetical protein